MEKVAKRTFLIWKERGWRKGEWIKEHFINFIRLFYSVRICYHQSPVSFHFFCTAQLINTLFLSISEQFLPLSKGVSEWNLYLGATARLKQVNLFSGPFVNKTIFSLLFLSLDVIELQPLKETRHKNRRKTNQDLIMVQELKPEQMQSKRLPSFIACSILQSALKLIAAKFAKVFLKKRIQ